MELLQRSIEAELSPTIEVEPPPDKHVGVAAAATPLLDENVQFTVYRPKAVQPAVWYPLLAFAHLSEKPLDAPPEAPDPIEEMRRQAERALGPQAKEYQSTTQDSHSAVPRSGELTLVPEVPQVEFNPPRRSFLWQESVHREEFRLRASEAANGTTLRGRLTVFLGSIVLADVPLVIRVDRAARQPAVAETEPAAARPYRKIFASYSHLDQHVVEELERYGRMLGDEYLRDTTRLRAGELWNDQLMRMIDEADVFQLFWSQNAMRSTYVRQEWEYALRLRRASFVRPTYWEDPLPNLPEQNLPPPELSQLHFQRIQVASTVAGMPTAGAADIARSGDLQETRDGGIARTAGAERAPASTSVASSRGATIRKLSAACGFLLMVTAVTMFAGTYMNQSSSIPQPTGAPSTSSGNWPPFPSPPLPPGPPVPDSPFPVPNPAPQAWSAVEVHARPVLKPEQMTPAERHGVLETATLVARAGDPGVILELPGDGVDFDKSGPFDEVAHSGVSRLPVDAVFELPLAYVDKFTFKIPAPGRYRFELNPEVENSAIALFAGAPITSQLVFHGDAMYVDVRQVAEAAIQCFVVGGDPGLGYTLYLYRAH